ncbi:MAG: MBL fold metallo-hydrolase, partial [Pseudomonadota bacterium]
NVVAGFNMAYELDDTYRIAHHGEHIVPPSGGGSIAKSFEMPESKLVVYDEGGVRVTAFAVDHSPVEPSIGYRFDYGSRSVCLSGDTVRSSNLELICKDVDILVHEALQPKFVKKLEDANRANGNEAAAKIMFDIVDYHSTPTDAAKSATATGADMLVLNHIVPPLPTSFIYPAFLDDAPDHYNGPIIVGEDGMFFSLPSASDAIEETTLM